MLNVLMDVSEETEREAIRNRVSREAVPLKLLPVTYKYVDRSGKEIRVPRSESEIAVMDITQQAGLEVVRRVRSHDGDLLLLLIADTSISPMKYVNASIRAEALLLKPWTERMLMQVVRDVLELEAQRREKASAFAEDEQEAFLAEADGRKWFIPYKDIYYFEARCKKVYVRTRNEEIGVYDTLDRIAERLPGQFLRCHRSYIVNKSRFLSVKLSENVIYLTGQMSVPLSRSYKAGVLEALGL